MLLRVIWGYTCSHIGLEHNWIVLLSSHSWPGWFWTDGRTAHPQHLDTESRMYFFSLKLENIRQAVWRQTEGEVICLQVSVNLNNKTTLNMLCLNSINGKSFFLFNIGRVFSPHSSDCGMRYSNLGSSLCERMKKKSCILTIILITAGCQLIHIYSLTRDLSSNLSDAQLEAEALNLSP